MNPNEKYTYFKPSEMMCSCCGWWVEDDFLLSMLTAARIKSRFPYDISSWCRCEKHDKEVRGEGNHTTGKAVDILYHTPQQRAQIVFDLVWAGFRRIGVSFKSGFVHADCVPGKPTPALWTY